MFTWGISAAHLFPSGLPPPWLTSLGNSRSLSWPRSSRRLRPLCLVRPPRPPSDWLPTPSWRRSSAEITVVDITRPGRQQPPGAQRHTWPPTTPQWGLKFTQNHPKESGMWVLGSSMGDPMIKRWFSPEYRPYGKILPGPHMFSVETACEKKFRSWKMIHLRLIIYNFKGWPEESMLTDENWNINYSEGYKEFW